MEYGVGDRQICAKQAVQFGAHVIQLRIDKGPDDPRQREEKRIICPTCDGLGIMVPHSQKCEYCCGRRLEPETVQVTIDIPAGSRHGDRIVINGVADQVRTPLLYPH
uniref:Chaperone DnaJ C-terminal domain-containing protein n=1 Tax=Spongospora subterranea TaxID=70186 RepID=A0A0H5RFL2_9EUKA|eukprot:CRZ12332.1 hypothetical protein [Spongospora subterranea]